LGLTFAALLSVGADEPKQTVDARGLTFEAPKSWKSSPPTSQMRRAQLKADPIEGDDYPAELIVFAFPGGAGSVEANIERWRKLFQDEDGNPPKIETEPVRKNARLLGAIITGGDVSYYIRMVGPDKTMKKLTPDFDEMLKTVKVGD